MFWGPQNPGLNARGEASQDQRRDFTKQRRSSGEHCGGRWAITPKTGTAELTHAPSPALRMSYLDVALVGCSYAPLHIHAQRSLGLLRRDGAHLGRALSAGYVARERAHWENEGALPSEPASSTQKPQEGACRTWGHAVIPTCHGNGLDPLAEQPVSGTEALGLWHQAAPRMHVGVLTGREGQRGRAAAELCTLLPSPRSFVPRSPAEEAACGCVTEQWLQG